MESFNFITPSRVRVLLVPSGGISSADFRRYTDIVKSISDVRLLDLTPIPECVHFNPQQFPQGRIFYNVSTEPSTDDRAFLDDFEPFRKTFLIIGIGLHSQSAINQERDIDTLKAQHPTAITHNIIYHQSQGEKNASHGIFHINAEAEKITTSIETVLCEITRNFLLALDAYASSFDSITLRSPISLTDSRVLTRTINQAQKRLSSGSSFKASFANGQPVHPPGKDLKLKSSQRQTGRKAKLMGNFFLLAGRSQDALQYFIDAAINLKKTDDHLWLASTLEGISVSTSILSFLGLSHQIQNPMFASVLQVPKSKGLSMMKASSKVSMESMVSRQSISAATPRNSTSSSLSLGANQPNLPSEVTQMEVIELLLLLASRSSYYYRASTSDLEDCVPDIVFIESLLRNVKLMTIIYLSNASDIPVIVRSLVGLDTVKNQKGCANFHISQQSIVAEIDQIFALQLNKLDLIDQCRIYSAMASIYHDLGLRRKYGLVLRLLLESLIPKISDIESNESFNKSEPVVSIKNIIEHLFHIYHIDTETEKLGISASRHYSDWIVLQLSLIKACLRIAEALRDFDTLMKLCVLTLSRFTHCLPIEDQIKLRDKLSWLSHISDSEFVNLQIPHPDPFLVRDAKFVVSSRSTKLVPFRIDESGLSSEKTEEYSSVFFDPFNKTSNAINMDKILCQNEMYQLKIELQNPFHYNLVIKSIDAVAEGKVEIATFNSMLKLVSVSPFRQHQGTETQGWKGASRLKKPIIDIKQLNIGEGITIPPNSSVEVMISFKALTAGPLQIRGFDVSLLHPQPQFFNIVNQEQFSGLEKLTHESSESIKEGNHTLEKLFSNLSMSHSERVSNKVISLIVIPSQPTLTTTKNDKSPWIMLLEGEIQSSSLHLKNCSSDPVDYLSISPWDSTIDSISSKLNSRQNRLNAAEVYELEFQLLEKKALSVTNKSEIASTFRIIKPGCEMRIDYEITGKRAMTESKLILEYGKKPSDENDRSFLKKLVVPFNVSVHRSLEIIANEILPLNSALWEILSNPNPDSNVRTKLDSTCKYGDNLLDSITNITLPSDKDVSDFCLLVLDIKNFWKDFLTVRITSKMEESDNIIIENSIAPNKTSRLFIPVRRIGGTLFDPFKVIPSLRKKQFIKNYNLTEEEDQQVRRVFWAKNELLGSLEGVWATIDKQKNGNIDLRRLNLNLPMTDLLIYDDISISHKIFDEEEKKEVKMQNNKFILEKEKFYILKTRIANHTERSVSGILRHMPFPLHVSNKQDLSIDQKILFNGVLQIHIGRDLLVAGGIYERDLGFMLLEKGQYEWGCIFDEFGEHEKRIIGREAVYIIA